MIATIPNGGGLALLLRNGIELSPLGSMPKEERENSVFIYKTDGTLISHFELIRKQDVIAIEFFPDGNLFVLSADSMVQIFTQGGILIKDFRMA